MSETAQRAAGVGEEPPEKGPWRGVAGGLWKVGRLFLRQREATVFVIALALFAYFWLSTSTFLTSNNMATMLSGYAAPIIILALGEVMLLISGEIDLSVGFIFTFAPFMMHYMVDFYGVPAILGIIIALLVGVAVGWINGFVTVTLGVPSFITTLGSSLILYGLVLTTSHAYPAAIPDSSKAIGQWIGGKPYAQIVWAVVLVVILHIVLTRTRWGLHTIAVGGNLLGAREAGIHVTRIKFGNFMISGFMGALVGLQVAFYDNTIDPLAGGYTPMFYAVAASVIGGTALLGGIGTILGAFLGAIVLAIMQDGFTIIGINANPLNIIFGAAILVAMVANVWLARLRGEGRIT